MTQCKICRKKNNNIQKMKNGCVCQSCLSAFPDSVKMNIENFSSTHLKKLSKLVQPASSKKWIESGVFGVGKNTISLNSYEFKLKDLRSVKLNFHPKQIGSHPNTVYGTITVIIETKRPHFIFEEPFFPNDITVSYGINGKNIYYHYSYAIENLFELIQKCIDNKTYDMTEYIETYQMRIHKEEELKKKKAEAEAKAKAEKEAEEKRKREEEAQKRAKAFENNQKKTKNVYTNINRTKPLSPFEESKLLFGVEIPYTTSQIKSIRNQLMKKYHPDMGETNSEDMCKKINEAYTLLLKYAKS